MRRFETLRQYSQVVDAVKYPKDPQKPFLIVYFSENSSLLEDYEKLNILPVDVRDVIVPVTKIPIIRLTTNMKKAYTDLGLRAWSTNQKIPSNKNVIIDLSWYLASIDEKYKPTTYRQRSGHLIKNLLMRLMGSFPSNYQKILLYSVDTNKPFNSYVNRKVFPFMLALTKPDEEPLYYNNLIMNTISGDSNYRLLIKDKKYQIARVIQYMKKIRSGKEDDEVNNDVESATTKVMNSIQGVIDPENTSKFKTAISSYLKKNVDDLEDVTYDEEITSTKLMNIATGSILHSLNGDVAKTKTQIKKITPDISRKVLKAIDKKYVDELLTREPSVNTSTNIQVASWDLAKVNEQKTPEHLFSKRNIDFHINLKKDLKNSFNVLASKDIPLNVSTIAIADKAERNGEIDKSDYSVITVTLVDKNGKEHIITIDIPKITADGTFRVRGQRKIIINQIVLCPIQFPKQYDSKFESSYSSFHIWSKRTKNLEMLEIYMGGFKMPLSILSCFSFGFEQTMKKYKIKYSIVDERPGKDVEWVTKISDGKYLVFGNVTSQLQKEFIQAFLQANISKYEIEKEFGTKEYFNDLIIKLTGRIQSTYQITNNLENIVDPVARQVLANKQLPVVLEDIMQYMAAKVVEGYQEDRNSLQNQRIRNSEVLVHLIQKQILAAYTEYKQQILSGNADAKFEIPTTKLMAEFNMSELATNMEYANPIEEMAVMTRVSPVGKTVGGIPDKGAITTKARNVHASYFGNIDPLDTSESENIGITQQLTVNAFITSSRGLIQTKDIEMSEGAGILSPTSAMIPYIENNDGARVMMAVNQARQAIPLMKPEAPIVQSGYESLLSNVLSENFIKRAKIAGKVTSITEDSITIVGKSKLPHDISPVHLKSGSGINTLSLFEPRVKVGQIVKEKQIIAEGSCVSEGAIALGRTLCCAVMPYKGYNFEDGIVISDALVRDHKLTSIHGIEEEILVSEKDRLKFIVNIGDYIEKGKPLLRKTIGELEELIGYDDLDEDETTDIHGQELVKKSPGGKIVDIQVFSNLGEDKYPELTDLIIRTKKKYKIKGNEKFTVRGTTVKGVLIKFIIEQERAVGEGDKLANRFGAKGIVSLVEKEENMPKTPWGDRVQIIVNPVGIIGRMNIGQLYELYTGLISKALAKEVKDLKTKDKVVSLYKKVFPLLDTTKNKNFSANFIKSISALSAVRYKEYFNQIIDKGFVPIIIPPFKAPSYKEIITVLRVLGIKDGYNLFLPEYNTKTISSVPVGYMYFQKLEHIGDVKLHARSTGPVTGKTMQPTAGKRRDGGQRLGELDTYSLIAYNATSLLAEFFGPLSDDAGTKNEIISEIIESGGAAYRTAKVSPVKDLLQSYFVSLMLTGK